MILELFPCSGGMAEGLRRAGLRPTMSFDWDDDARDSYERNLGHRPIAIDVRELVRMVRGGWTPGLVRLLVADPPCTPWSRAGKRLGTDDERDLLEETVELIALLRPESWLIANVPGLDDGPNWGTVQRTIGSLSIERYCIDFARFDAADYGVPQHRVRPFWYGHRYVAPCVCWPERTHASPAECRNATLPGVADLRPWATCRDALAHLSPEELGSPVRLRWRGCNGYQIASVPDRPARVVGVSNLSDGNILAHPTEAVRDRRGAREPEPSYTVTTKGDGRGAHGSCVMAWPWDVPSTTVMADDRIPPPGHHPESGSILTSPNAIKLSERAAAILQGFPEGWVFAGKTKRARWAQIGMAMPPPLAEAVARSIARAMRLGEADSECLPGAAS